MHNLIKYVISFVILGIIAFVTVVLLMPDQNIIKSIKKNSYTFSHPTTDDRPTTTKEQNDLVHNLLNCAVIYNLSNYVVNQKTVQIDNQTYSFKYLTVLSINALIYYNVAYRNKNVKTAYANINKKFNTFYNRYNYQLSKNIRYRGMINSRSRIQRCINDYGTITISLNNESRRAILLSSLK